MSSPLDVVGERIALLAPRGVACAVRRSKAAPYGALRSRWPALRTCDLAIAKSTCPLRLGGAYRDRTDDLMLAKQPLSQLS